MTVLRLADAPRVWRQDSLNLIFVKVLVAGLTNMVSPVWLNQEVHVKTKPVVPVGTRHAVTRRETNPFSFLQQEIDRLFDGVSRHIPGFATTEDIKAGRRT